MATEHNKQYERFANYFVKQLNMNTVTDLQKEFEKDEYSGKPGKIREKIEEVLDSKWSEIEQQAQDRRATEKGVADARRKGFEKLKNRIIDQGNIKKDSDNRKIAIDFSPMLEEYEQSLRVRQKKLKPSKRIEKLKERSKEYRLGEQRLTNLEMLNFIKGKVPNKEFQLLKDDNNRFRIQQKYKDVSGQEQFRVIAPAKFLTSLEKNLEYANQSGRLADIAAIRDIAQDKLLTEKRLSPKKLEQLQSILKKSQIYINDSLTEKKRIGASNKSIADLKKALELNAVSFQPGASYSDLKKIAKANGIGIRNYQKTRNELIYSIKLISPEADINYINELGDKELKSALKSLELKNRIDERILPTINKKTKSQLINDILKIKPEIKPELQGYNIKDLRSTLYDLNSTAEKSAKKIFKKRLPFISDQSLPVSDEAAKKIFVSGRAGIAPSQINSPNLNPITKQQVLQSEKNFEGLKKIYTEEAKIKNPHLSKNKVDRIVNKRLAAEGLDVFSPELLIEQRYLEWKYRNYPKVPKIPSYVDLQEISRLKPYSKVFRNKITKGEEQIIDPISKKQKDVKVTITRNWLKQELPKYKERLKDKTEKFDNFIGSKEGAEFIKKTSKIDKKKEAESINKFIDINVADSVENILEDNNMI